MRPDLWRAYTRLQSDYAYGDGVSVGHNEDVGPLPLPEGMDRSALLRVLQIGPGGVSEVRAMRKALPTDTTLYAITLHQREVELISLYVPGVNPQVGDMHDMAFPDGAFDLVLASQVLEHSLAPYIALLECRRVLRWGGHAWFIMPSFDMSEGGRGPFHLHCLTEEVWTELLRKTGLPPVSIGREAGATGGVYTSYVCKAGLPPEPHASILRDITILQRGR